MQYLATHFTLEDAFQISGSRFFAVLVLRRTPYQHGASQKAGERFLQDVRLHIERPLPCIPTLDLEVPAGKAWALPDFFSYVPDPWEAEALLCASTLFQKTTQIARRAHDARPPMPLRLGHVALQLATGHLDGVVGEGEERHIVRGRVLRTKVEEQLGPDEIISRDILSTEIRALTKEGRPVNLMSQSEGGESA
jgi:hypothetical protein